MSYAFNAGFFSEGVNFRLSFKKRVLHERGIHNFFIGIFLTGTFLQGFSGRDFYRDFFTEKGFKGKIFMRVFLRI